MELIHRLLAWATVAGVLAGLAWSAVLAVRGRHGGAAFERFQAMVVSLLLVTAASGLLRLALGARPADGLHLLYAAVAVAIIPLARSFLGGGETRRATWLALAAFAVLGGLVLRLFMTG